MRRTSLALLLALGSTPATAPAALYRCVGPDGHVTYSDIPCAQAASATAIEPDPPPRESGTGGLRPGERELLARAYRRDDQDRARHERVARNGASELRLNRLRKRKDAISEEMASTIGGAAHTQGEMGSMKRNRHLVAGRAPIRAQFAETPFAREGGQWIRLICWAARASLQRGGIVAQPSRMF